MALPPNPYNAIGTFNYFNPGSIYGSKDYTTPGAFGQSPLGDTFLEQNRDSSFTQWLANNNFRDNSAMGDYARAQESKINRGYGAAQGVNPNLRYRQYLDQNLAGRLREDFARLTPTQRGESTSQFAPRARATGWR